MIEIAIVEDDLTDLKRLENYIKKYATENNLEIQTEHFNNGIVFLEKCRSNIYDIILMDIQMPHLNGMETAHKLRDMQRKDQLIFVTNLGNYAIEGYEVNASDFIVKPITYEQFSYKFNRAVQQVQIQEAETIVVKQKNSFSSLPIKNLIYIESQDHRVFYHTFQSVIETWDSMKNVEKKLLPYSFSRCSVGFLVNLRYVTEINENTCIVHNTKLTISRSRKQQFINDFLKTRG